MTGRTHVLIGATTPLAAGVTIGAPLVYVGAVSIISAAVSRLPDLAEKPLGRKKPIFKHRTITHYPALQIVLVIALAFAASVAGAPADVITAASVGAACGLVMHSVADAMTVDPSGIRLLWPISRRGYHVLPRSLRVWSDRRAASQWVFAAVWCLLVAGLIYARLRHQIPA